MGRHISSRLKIRGELIAETPLHVGGYGESFETDLALARNGNDEFYIPGTSLTGALRCWFENSFGKPDTIELTAPPERIRSNFVNGIKRMPVRVSLH